MRDREEQSGGYEPVHYESLFRVEDQHFWFRARNKVISILAKQAVSNLPAEYRVLEMGCGDGNVLRYLETACPTGKVVGMDFLHEGLRYARRRTACDLVQADVGRSPFGKAFDLIGMFDVLEHVPDDRRVLLELRGMLGERGVLLVTVPAHRYLWSYFDELAGHCRRYEPEELRRKLEDAGYVVEYLTPYMSILHPFLWLSRKLRSRTSGAAVPAKTVLEREIKVIPIVNGIFSLGLSCELRLIEKRKQLPFGASLVAVARKRR